MQTRLVIAYSLIAIMVVLVTGWMAWLRHNTRARKIRRYYKARDAERADKDRPPPEV